MSAARSSAALLLHLARRLGPCLGWDLDLLPAGERATVPCRADDQVVPDLVASFRHAIEGGEGAFWEGEAIDLRVGSRDPSRRLVRIRAAYLAVGRVSAKIDLGEEGSLFKATAEICARDGIAWLLDRIERGTHSLIAPGDAIFAPLRDPLILAVPDVGDIDPRLLRPAPGTPQQHEISMHAFVRAAIAIPESVRADTEPGLCETLAAMLAAFRLSEHERSGVAQES